MRRKDNMMTYNAEAIDPPDDHGGEIEAGN